MEKPCKHEWTSHPLPQAEFKCVKCGALGHWAGNMCRDEEFYARISPYRCQRYSCGDLAVEVVHAVRLCIKHRNEEKERCAC